MQKQYIVTNATIQPFFTDNDIVDFEDIVEAYNDASDWASELLSVELAEVTDIVNNETSCVIEHSKERITLASLVL